MSFNFQRSILILLLGLASNGFAATNSDDEERWYDIEILIFENVGQAGLSSETWPVDPALPDFGNAVELVPAQIAPVDPALPGDTGATGDSAPVESTAPKPYQLLTSNDFNLTPEEIKLSKSEKFYPLLHVAWRQPVLSDKDAKAVHIHSTMEQSQDDDIFSSDETLALPPNNDFFTPQSNSDSALPMNVIDGTIKVTLSKYLHLEADLLYRVKAEQKNEFNIFGFRKEEPSLTAFKLKDSRRMRSGEIHYFDHPLFGMLVRITPYQLAGQPPDEAQTVPLDEPTAITEEQEPDNDNELRNF